MKILHLDSCVLILLRLGRKSRGGNFDFHLSFPHPDSYRDEIECSTLFAQVAKTSQGLIPPSFSISSAKMQHSLVKSK